MRAKRAGEVGNRRRRPKLPHLTRFSQFANYLRTSPNATIHTAGSHVTATCADTGMRITVTDHNRECPPGLRRDIIRAIIACGFAVVALVVLI